MPITSRAPTRAAFATLAAILMCGVSTAALAEPRSSAAASQQAMADTIAALRAALEEERAARAASDARVQALSDRLTALEQTTQAASTQRSESSSAVATLGSTVETLNAAPTVALGNGRPTFSTRDGAFTASLRSSIYLDAAFYDQAAPGPVATDLRRGATASDTGHARDLNSGTVFRRARLGIDGKVFGDFTYSLITEFGGSGTEDAGKLYEMYVQYNGIPNTAIRVGAFEPQVGMSANVSTTAMMMMERPSVADITRGLAAGDSRTAIQVAHWGEFGGDASLGGSYMISGAFTGSAPNSVNSAGGFASQPFDEQRGLSGRLAIAPTPNADTTIHLGLNGSYVLTPADASGPDAAGVIPAGAQAVQLRDRPELRIDGTRLIDTGAIDASHAWHYGFEAAVQYGPFLLEGEYLAMGVNRRNSTLADPRFNGWYVEGGWMITGERRRYNTVNGVFDGAPIANPWQPGSGGFGAWELALRYSTVDLNFREGAPGTAPAADSVRGGRQTVASVGVNWYMNSNLRFMLDYLHVDVDRLSPNAATFNTPTGAQIGQQYDAVALRAQFGF